MKLVATHRDGNKREVDGFSTTAQEETREELLVPALSPVVGGVTTTRETVFVLSDIPSTPQLWAELQIFKWIPSERKDYATGVQQECRSHPLPLHPSLNHPIHLSTVCTLRNSRRKNRIMDSLKALLTL